VVRRRSIEVQFDSEVLSAAEAARVRSRWSGKETSAVVRTRLEGMPARGPVTAADFFSKIESYSLHFKI
jgi:hypothetical protein